MATMKLIKSKSFKTDNVEGTHYTVAYKGRVFGVNTLNFTEESDDAIVVNADNKTLKLNVKCEVRKRTNTDMVTGEVTTYLDIVPKCDLDLAAF